MATPFTEIHQADFGGRPTVVRCAVLVAMFYLISFLVVRIFPWAHPDLPGSGPLDLSPPILTAVGLTMILMGWYWIKKRATARQNRVEELRDVTRLSEAVAGQRLLVIRAIDDEASLIMALGAIVNYLTARSIMCIYWIIITLPISVLAVRILSLLARRQPWEHSLSWYYDVVGLLCSALVITLLGLLAVARLVHGQELAASPMECQINTQAAPDAIDLSQIVTLVSHRYVKTLRHGIYEHDNCAKVISDWVRSQLGAQLVR
jgi:hypothetical protein